MSLVRTPEDIDWPGLSGTLYRYYIFPFDGEIPDLPGNYIFARQDPQTSRWYPLYIGEAGDGQASLRTRLIPSHEKVPCITKLGGGAFVHIHANFDGTEARRIEELDLIDHWNPPCNG